MAVVYHGECHSARGGGVCVGGGGYGRRGERGGHCLQRPYIIETMHSHTLPM